MDEQDEKLRPAPRSASCRGNVTSPRKTRLTASGGPVTAAAVATAGD